MSQVNLLEFQDYLIYEQSFNNFLQSEQFIMQPNIKSFQPPPAISLEPSIEDDGVPKRSPARLFDRWRSSAKNDKQDKQTAVANSNTSTTTPASTSTSPQTIKKQEVPIGKFDRSEPSSPLSISAISQISSISDSSAASVFSDAKNNYSMQMLLLDDNNIDDMLEDIDDAEIHDVEKVTVRLVSSGSCTSF